MPRGADLLPYAPRPHQVDLVDFLEGQLRMGGHAVAQSGTGTGKTVSALSAALAVARDQAKRVLYLTRTNSQARQVMREHRALRPSLDALGGGRAAVAVALQGRQHLCPLRREEPEMQEADAEELGTMCRDRMKAAEDVLAERKTRVPPCRFHQKGLEEGLDVLMDWARRESPEAEALSARTVAEGRCPYTLSRALLPEAELVVAPYVYYLSPALRGALLQWMGAAPSDLLVIVDEAHNLPDYARELASASLGRRSLERAQREVREFGDPPVLGETKLSQVLTALEEVLEEARREHIPDGEEDALLPPDELDVLLLPRLRASTPGLDRALVQMEEYGAAVRAARRARAKLPRSYVGAIATFLRAYRAVDSTTHTTLIEAPKGEARLTAYAVDPSVVTGALAETAGSIHLSGTLVPLEEYRDTTGLPRPTVGMRTFPSPFPPENRLVLVDEETTTRHEDVTRDPAHWDLLRQRLHEIRAATDRNMAVFAPSHDTLDRLAPALIGPGALIERRGDPQRLLMELVDEFRGSHGGTLASVIGGRISEGLDFPSDELEVVVVVGLPYARPTAKLDALLRFHERKSGRGWEYAVKVPMVRKVLQAAGRLIRTPTDRGVVILLDRRAAMLRDVLPEMIATTDPASHVRRFFPTKGGSAPPSRPPAEHE